MAANLTNWSPYKQKVDNSARAEGKFMSGAFTLLAAGPPRLASIGGTAAGSNVPQTGTTAAAGSDWAMPIGVVQSFNLGHSRSFSRFWELGSERSYFISGRTVAQAGFGRVLYNGPSLLRMMYSFYKDIIPPSLVPNIDGIAPANLANQHNVVIPPGFENIYLNLASDLFSQPCGLLVYMRDSNEQTMGAVYLEETYIPSHSIATDAQGVVMQEQVSLQPERVVPVAVNAIALFSSLVTDLVGTT